MCGYFCNEFIDFILECKSLVDYTNLFSPDKYEKNDKIILNYFQELTGQDVLFVFSIGILKILK